MATFDESITDSLDINDSCNPIYVKIKNPGVIDICNLRQSLSYTLTPDPKRHLVTDSITLTQSISGSKVKPGDINVVVTQSIAYNINTGRSIVDALGVSDSVTAYLSNHGYNFVDPNVVTYVGTLTAALVKLVGATTIYLRKPDFGDKDSFEAFRIQRTSRGGDLQVFQDSIWPTTEILEFKFSYLLQTDITTLLTFMTDNLGASIDLYDQYGRHWKGFIITPENQVVQSKRIGFEVTFRFQGVLQ